MTNPSAHEYAVRFRGRELARFDNWDDAWRYRMTALTTFMVEIMTPPGIAPPEVIRVGGDS